MLSYVNSKRAEDMGAVVDVLAQHYEDYGSWRRLQLRPHRFHEILRQYSPGFSPPAPPHLQRPRAVDDFRPTRALDSQIQAPPLNRGSQERSNRRRPPPPKPIIEDVVLSNLGGETIIGRLNPEHRYKSLPIQLDEQLVGQLHYRQRNEIVDGYELAFIEEQRQTIGVMAALLVVCVGLFSFPLARHLVNPVRELAMQTKKLTQGNYSDQLAIERRDEIGALSRDITLLGKTLQKNETMRQRWVADTSHELRTPVALLRAQLEALQDGVRQATPEHLQMMSEEVARLSSLIDDLQQLSLSDLGALQYDMRSCSLDKMLGLLEEKHRQSFEEKGIDLGFNIQGKLSIKGDKLRLQQLFDNILNNSLKYTDADGTVHVNATSKGRQVRVDISDSKPGVSEEQLSHLFDYLYRAEPSRNRETGGSGLGLSICRHIAEAHDAKISLSHAEEGGLKVSLLFPALLD